MNVLSQERHERLLAYLNEHKTVRVKEASELLSVTEKTIRLDFEALEGRKLLRRVHGGAILENEATSLFPIETRQQSHGDKKQAIAQKALSLIGENEIILLDGGSTTLALAKELGSFPVSVLTNDLQIAFELYPKEKIQLVMLGGTRIGDSSALYSRETTKMLSSMFVKKLFLGATGVSLTHGLSVLQSYHVEWKQEAITSAEETVLLADSTKFGQVGLMPFAQLDDVQYIVSDDGIASEYVNAFDQKKIAII